MTTEWSKASVLDDLSPKDLYWDPRYQQYFFVGNLKPLPSDGTDGDDGASTVELAPTARTRKPSILVTEGRRPEKRRRHISWSAPKSRDEATHPRVSVACSCTLCAFALLLILTIALWVSGALNDVAQAARIAETTTPAGHSSYERYPERLSSTKVHVISSAASKANTTTPLRVTCNLSSDSSGMTDGATVSERSS